MKLACKTALLCFPYALEAASWIEISTDMTPLHRSQLERNITFDLVVSPANSYGLLDGGFDDAISRAWSPATNYLALTRAVQAQIYGHSRGYLPVGHCFIATIPPQYKNQGRYGTDWGCRYIAMCPTMRTPQDVTWDKEVVYECIWSLLNAIDRHNSAATTDGERIRSILMTPLATGVGGVPLEKWAEQTVMAMKHFLDAQRRPDYWGTLGWSEVAVIDHELGLDWSFGDGR
jgi:O-acetyl-ADP-ribose deacetylase (regulator of RNase III)